MTPEDKVLLDAIVNYCETLSDAVKQYRIDEEGINKSLALRGMTAFFVQQVGECSIKLSKDFKTLIQKLNGAQ